MLKIMRKKTFLELSRRLELLEKQNKLVFDAVVRVIEPGKVALVNVPNPATESEMRRLASGLHSLAKDFYDNQPFGIVFICGADRQVVIGGEEKLMKGGKR